MDQPGLVVNLAVNSDELTREMRFSLSPFAPENLVLRDVPFRARPLNHHPG